jgi:hypothetical protein
VQPQLPQAATASSGAEPPSSSPVAEVVPSPPPSRAVGLKPVRPVVEAGIVAAVPVTPDPLRLDAGFLFRDRK